MSILEEIADLPPRELLTYRYAPPTPPLEPTDKGAKRPIFILFIVILGILMFLGARRK